MNERPLRPVRPGGQLSAREFNRALDRVDSTSDFGGAGVSDEFNQILIDNPQPLKTNARILSGSNPYAWEEVRQIEDNSWVATGALSGTTTSNPLMERNGVTDAAAGEIYEATFDSGPSAVGRWYFNVSGAGGGGDNNTLCGWGAVIPNFDAGLRNIVEVDAAGCFTISHPSTCTTPAFIYGGTLP